MTMLVDVHGPCSGCGSPRRAEDRFCAQCGQALLATRPGVLASNVAPAQTTAPSSASTARAWTHPGLAFALVCLTFGLYTFYWFFQTWREIKRHDGDEGKRPLGHALAICVPVYGLFRLHAHMRTIAGLVRSSGGMTTLSPGTAVVMWMAANALCSLGSHGKLGLMLNLVGVLLEGGMVAWGQSAINRAWYLHNPQARVRPTHPGHWVVLGVGTIVSGLMLVGLAT